MDRIKGKVAIVTGAASGIGRATALLLAQEGASIVIVDINAKGGKEVAEEIKRNGGDALFIEHDVTDEDGWKDTIKQTLDKYGKLDIMVNDAGTMILKSIENMTLDDWRFQMGVNVEGVFLGTKYAIGAMKKSGGGSIINISSSSGMVGTVKDGSAYCASKGAVRVFTKAAAMECCKDGFDYNIRVNSIHPGGIDTPLSRSLMKDENVRKAADRDYPIGHMGEPFDIAYAVLYLASEESKFATGSELVVDGGVTMK